VQLGESRLARMTNKAMVAAYVSHEREFGAASLGGVRVRKRGGLFADNTLAADLLMSVALLQCTVIYDVR
jgi:hypothetical protein